MGERTAKVCVRAILLFNNNTYAQATEIHTDRYTRRYNSFTGDYGGIKGFPTMASLKLSPGFAKVKYNNNNNNNMMRESCQNNQLMHANT